MPRTSIFPKRVLMSADTLTGTWTFALSLARGLQQFEVHVALATLGRPLGRDQRRIAHGLRNLDIYESSYRLEWMEDPWRDVRDSGEWLLRVEEDVAPDLVHLNSLCHGGLPWKTPTLVAAHADALSWWLAVKGTAPPASLDRYREEVTRSLKSAALVVAPSRAGLDAIEKFYSVGENVRIIPHGRNPAGLRRGNPAAPAGTLFSKERFVITAGRLWDEAKNISALDRVVPSLGWPVVAVGSQKGPDGREIHFDHLELSGELAQDELAACMTRASIFALPARYEPSGFSILEAALSGCALVLGDLPTLRETWQDAALFVPAGEDGSLRQALRYLIDEPARRQDLAQRSWERARFLSADRMASAYFQEYRRLIQPRVELAGQISG